MFQLRRIAATAVAALALAAHASAGDVFRNAGSQRIDGGGGGMLPGDYDGDGNRDIVIFNAFDGIFHTMLGDGTGGFTRWGLTPVRNASGAVAGDLNRDGRDDLLVVGGGPLYSLVASATDRGAFVVKSYGGNFRSFPGIGDLNSDGRVDFVAPTQYGNQLAVGLGNGDGTFGPTRLFDAGWGGDGPRVRDLNGDGKPDVLAVNPGNGQLVRYLGKGDGTFESGTPMGPTPGFGGVTAFADFNNDGIEDTAVLGAGSSIVVTLRNAAAAEGPGVTTPIHGDIRAWAVADFDADGRVDIAGLDAPTGNLNFFRGDGSGTFADPDVYAIPLTLPGDWATGLMDDDLNHDGTPDLAVLTSAGVFTVLAATTPTPVPEPTAPPLAAAAVAATWWTRRGRRRPGGRTTP